MTVSTLPLSGLRIDKSNVRTVRGTDNELIASLTALGVQVPLIVRPNGVGHVVTDGGNRLIALQAMAKAGTIPADFPVPVTINKNTDAQARETSLAVNVIRHAMHPVDEFRAFTTLHTDKAAPMDVDAIALRFGLTPKAVAQRLALGALCDAVLDAWKAGEIKGETAQAFTLCTNKKLQAQLFAKLHKPSNRLDAYEVKRALRGDDQHQAARLLDLVGQEAYEARGGKVTLDLFGTDHVISDVPLLNAMRDEYLAASVEKLKADGWSFVLTEQPKDYYTWGRIETKSAPTPAETARLKAIDKVLKQDDDGGEDFEALETERDDLNEAIRLRGFSAKDKAKSGCIVTMDREGDVSIAYGVVPPKAQAAKVAAAAAKPGEEPAKAKKPAVLSQALVQRVQLMFLKGTKSALLADTQKTPLAVILAGVVASQITADRAFGTTEAVNKALDKIRDAITPKLMNEHQRKAFDAADYFGSAPKAFNLKAIAEAVSDAESKKLVGKTKAVIAKFATANVGKTKWLPKELRVAGYDGPKAKGAKK